MPRIRVWACSAFAFLISTQLLASTCATVTNKVHRDMAKYADAISKQQLPWMNLTWLQRTLGYGKRTVLPNMQFEYNWRCPEDSGAFLTVVTDNKGTVIGINGINCSEEGCNLFSAALAQPAPIPVSAPPAIPAAAAPPPSQQPPTTTTPPPIAQQPPAAPPTTEPANAIKLYNQLYLTSVKNEDQMKTDLLFRLKNYYANLRRCTPGIYHYAIPGAINLVFLTTVIRGEESGQCFVDTSVEDLNNAMPAGRKIFVKCEYQPKSLELYTDQEAEKVAQGLMTSSKENPSAVQQAEDTQCKTYIRST